MILLFAGAGASAAIDTKRYPTTTEFYEQLNDEVKSLMTNVLGGELNRCISKEVGDKKSMDIEKVLWYIDQFKYDLNPCLDNKRIAHKFIQKQGLMNAKNISPYISELSTLEEKIYREIHNAYYNLPSNSDVGVWNHLIKRLKEDEVIEIFTTNYDLVLERVANEENINTGTRLDEYGRSLFDYSFSDVGQSNYNGRLTKLHGSINWKREGRDIVITSNDYLGNTNCILYPGFKTIPGDEPFRRMHDHLHFVSGGAEVAIFIGFSFRDEYINQILRSIPHSTSKIIINMDSEEETFHDDFPFTKENCRHIGSGFSKKSVDLLKVEVEA